MASLISSMAKEIFQILKGSGRTLSLFDEHGNKVFEPESAISFFAEPDKLMVNIDSNGSNSAMNLYISDSADIDTMKKMIDNMRNMATRYNFLLNVRKYGKDLSPKDFAFKATPMMESMWGSAKTSYQTIGNAKLIIRHSSRISEEVRGARSRRIHSIFVETENGERFRCPMNSLHGARAFAKHLASGGETQDNFSKYIFAECGMQEKVNRVRRHIRKLGETSDVIAKLSETLNNVVNASKARITKSKGTRFYTGIVEQIINAPNHVGPLAGEIAEQVEELKSLLNIDETHSLYPVLESVAKTILETKQMDPINFEEETLLKTYVFEADELVEDLIESLVGEFGFAEGVHFERAANGVAMLSEEALDGATMYLQGFEGFKLEENPQDKFLMYATQWVKNRMNKAGMDKREMEQADVQKQATELATGLKQVVAGALSVKIKGGEMPRFASKEAAISFKLDKLLAPGSGLGNDMLWNFVSTLSDKLGNGDAMDANERFFAQKLADLVDRAAVKEDAIMPELNQFESWMNEIEEAVYGEPGDEYPGALSSAEEKAFEKIINSFTVAAFVDAFGSDFHWANRETQMAEPSDMTYSFNYIRDSVAGYLATKLEDELGGPTDIDVTDAADDLTASQVIPFLEEHGYIIELSEQFDMTVFSTDIIEDGSAGMDPAIKELVQKALSEISSSDFYGIISGDDADDDLYNLLHALKSYIENHLDLTDHAEEIRQMAQSAWGHNEGLEEAGNYPDDYDAKRDPNAQSDESADLDDMILDIIHTPPQGSLLAKVDASWFEGEGDEDFLKDLVSDVLGYAAEQSERDYGADYVEGDEAHYSQLAYKALKQKFFPQEGVLDEDSRQLADAERLSLKQLIDLIPSFTRKAQGKDVNAVYADMAEYFMDSRTMGVLLHKYESQIKAQIAAAMAPVAECDDEMAIADQGDDFVNDITYHDDSENELAHIARLRKLAGL